MKQKNNADMEKALSWYKLRNLETSDTANDVNDVVRGYSDLIIQKHQSYTFYAFFFHKIVHFSFFSIYVEEEQNSF